jgi:hypothetical protein
VDLVGSEYGPLVGCCKYGAGPSGSGATELVTNHSWNIRINYFYLMGRKQVVELIICL